MAPASSWRFPRKTDLADHFHASAVLVDDRGVLVTGPSGSGKTSLCLALVAQCRIEGVAGRLVADDQVLLSAANGRLIATAPEPIAGLLELRGFGPAPLRTEPRMVVDLLVRLVEPEVAPRIAGEATAELAGCPIPLLELPARLPDMAARAVMGFMRLPPFRP